MSDQQQTPQSRPDDADEAKDEAKDEAGEREQGVLSEDSEDISSPQLTVPRDDV
jgi:hypothetical protein